MRTHDELCLFIEKRLRLAVDLAINTTEESRPDWNVYEEYLKAAERYATILTGLKSGK